MKQKKIKDKKCKNCREFFTPFNSLVKACSVKCALELVNTNRTIRYKKETVRLKKELSVRDRSKQTKLAQQAFNAWIRARDEHEPCVSCRRFHQGQYHAGHFYTTASHPEIRFEPLNCHKQCSVCNNHLSANMLEYRKHLLVKIGHKNMAWLEGPHPPANFTVDDIIAIKILYKRKLKEGDFSYESR